MHQEHSNKNRSLGVSTRSLAAFSTSVIVVVVLGGIYVFLYSALGRIGREASHLVAETEAGIRKESRLLESRQGFDRTEVERMSLRAAFLSRATIAEFVEMLEELGRANEVAVTIKRLDIAATEEQPEHPALISLDVFATGSWAGVYKFMRLLEALPRAMVLDNATLRYAGKVDGAKVWSGSFSFAALALP